MTCFGDIGPGPGLGEFGTDDEQQTNLFGVVPPVFYPLGRVAIEWRSAVLLLPTSAAAALVDAAAGLDPITTNEAILAAGALTVEAIALFAFGIYWARWTARET